MKPFCAAIIPGDGETNNASESFSQDEVKRQIEAATIHTLTHSLAGESPSESKLDGQIKPLFISASELMKRPAIVRKLIGKVIQRGTTGQVFGPSGDGKTFVVLDQGLSVATGTTWNEIQCEQGLVVYFAGEGIEGLKNRIRAWSKQHNRLDLSDFHLSLNIASFDAAGLRHVVAEMKRIESCSGKKVALIIIDTLARHLQGDENSTKDMSEFVRAVDGIRAEFSDSTAIIVHHTGNDAEKVGRSRGSSALKAACDFEIQCMKGVLTFTKMKDTEAPPKIEFKLLQVEIGTDEETDEPITSCVVQYGERSFQSKQDAKVHMTPAEKGVFRIISGSPGISFGDVRAEFFRQKILIEPEAKPNSVGKAFTRAMEGLIDKRIMTPDGALICMGQSDKTGQMSSLSPM